jgi:2-iminobutanoate/2-iminopropanoate deaminase
MMSKRKSITVEGLHHGAQPIPTASLVGGVLASGGIAGLDPATGKVAEELDEQVRVLFANVERVVAAAGGSTGDIVRLTFYTRDRSSRDAINREWLAMFPDDDSRPARHTLVYALPDPMLVQCDLLAVIDTEEISR